MSYLSRLSLANRSIVALATIAILLLGAYVIPSLKQELYPSLAFPAVSIVAAYPGASPSIVEKDVTDPLEQSIQGLQGIQQTNSYSNESSALIIVQYNFGTDLDKASQKLTQQISRVQASLPSGVTPQVQTFNLSDLPVMQLAITSSQDEATLATKLNSDVKPVLQGIDGVADVSITGLRNQIVRVTLDADKLKEKGLSSSQVENALRSNNSITPAGELAANGQSLSIRVGSTLTSLDDIKNLVVGEYAPRSASSCPSQTAGAGASAGFPGAGSYPGGTPGAGYNPGAGASAGSQLPSACTAAPAAAATPVKLSDVATVEQTLAASTTLTRTNSHDSLGISITKTSDGNTVSISNAIRDQIPSLESKLGGDAKIIVTSDQAPSVSSAIDSLVREALIGAVFAILVILVFLFSIRSTLVTAISIPLSIVIALIGLWIGDYTLNLFTLGGLTIAIGRVVDDSIVVLENIFRHPNSGEDKRVAIPAAVKEVAGAVTASTLTTVAVFLPIAFVGGIIGEVFGPFSITVTIALLASLFVALTIIPVLAYWFLKPAKRAVQQSAEPKPGLLERGYIPLIRWVTSHKAITIIVSFLLFVGSLTLLPRLGTNFFSSQQQDSFTISQTLPTGSDLATTDAAAKKVEAVLADVQHIQRYQVTIGSGGSGFFSRSGASYNSASFTVTVDDAANEATVQ